jgi:peptidoglycan/LPS O-acetylase OafA/YrhL
VVASSESGIQNVACRSSGSLHLTILRIFPVYNVVLLAHLGRGGANPTDMAMVVYLHDELYIWHHLSFPATVPHFWTLAVEEQFYLVWPWAVLFLPRKWLLPFVLTSCCLGPAWRLYASFHYSPENWNAAFTFSRRRRLPCDRCGTSDCRSCR